MPYVTAGELESDAFRYFRKKALESTRLTKEDLDISDEELLSSLLLTEGKYLKRAAMLLFHQIPEKWAPGAFVKIGFFENDINILYQDEIRGPLITLPDKVLDSLYHKYFKGLISYRGIQRIETFPVARSALREAVLNAVIHKDYSTGIPIQIRVYEDKVYIFNNGSLPDGWTIEKLMTWHESIPRNPLIASAFYRSGMIESWGRGIGRILESCREEGKLEPTFEASQTGVRILFPVKIQTTTETNSTVHFGVNFGVNFGANFGANETQKKILDLMVANPKIKTQEIADTINLTKRNVEYVIRGLKKRVS